jgi:DNA (cytosine-5)-methyltransferase 1
MDAESETLIPTIGRGFDVTHSLRGEGFDASEDGAGRGTPLVPVTAVALTASRSSTQCPNEDTTLVPVAFGVGEQPDLGHCLRSGASKADKHESTTYVAQPIAWDEELNPSVNQAGTLLRGGAGGRHDGVAVPVAFHPTQDPISSTDVCHAIGTGNGQGCATAAVAVDTYNHTVTGDYTGSLTTTGGPPLSGPGVLQAMQVRRLTPEECEALQGFPRLYTAIPWRNKPSSDCPDGPRYKALGNSWAVPVVRWIGKRIQTQLA